MKTTYDDIKEYVSEEKIIEKENGVVSIELKFKEDLSDEATEIIKKFILDMHENMY